MCKTQNCTFSASQLMTFSKKMCTSEFDTRYIPRAAFFLSKTSKSNETSKLQQQTRCYFVVFLEKNKHTCCSWDMNKQKEGLNEQKLLIY